MTWVEPKTCNGNTKLLYGTFQPFIQIGHTCSPISTYPIRKVAQVKEFLLQQLRSPSCSQKLLAAMNCELMRSKINLSLCGRVTLVPHFGTRPQLQQMKMVTQDRQTNLSLRMQKEYETRKLAQGKDALLYPPTKRHWLAHCIT